MGHSSTLINDFIWNMEAYVQTLYEIKHDVSMNADTLARCEGYFNKITDPLFKLNCYFLKSVCGILKKFSYQLGEGIFECVSHSAEEINQQWLPIPLKNREET